VTFTKGGQITVRLRAFPASIARSAAANSHPVAAGDDDVRVDLQAVLATT